MTTTYKAKGQVLGNLWGSGQGCYPTVTLTADTMAELEKMANEMLESGELDSGMGFESLIGAVLFVERTDTIESEGKEYRRTYHIEPLTVGKLTEEQADFIHSLP